MVEIFGTIVKRQVCVKNEGELPTAGQNGILHDIYTVDVNAKTIDVDMSRILFYLQQARYDDLLDTHSYYSTAYLQEWGTVHYTLRCIALPMDIVYHIPFFTRFTTTLQRAFYDHRHQLKLTIVDANFIVVHIHSLLLYVMSADVAAQVRFA